MFRQYLKQLLCFYIYIYIPSIPFWLKAAAESAIDAILWMLNSAPRALSKKRSRLDGNTDREFAPFAIGSEDESEARPIDKALEATLPLETDANPDDIYGDNVSADMTSAADIAAAVIAQMNPVLDVKLRTLESSIDQKLGGIR